MREWLMGAVTLAAWLLKRITGGRIWRPYARMRTFAIRRVMAEGRARGR